MTKTFCDRCGKEITEECGWITHRMLYASIKLLPCKKHAEWSKREDLYICPECEGSYIWWFMNPETENGRKTAHWVFGNTMGHSWMKCSECCVSQSGQTGCWTYCPNCGAEMKGETEVETD